MTPQVVLSFDFGLTETGVAVGQTITGNARGVATLVMKDGKPKWREIQTLITEYTPTLLLVGLPLHMSGEESDMSGAARDFADRLEAKFDVSVALQDERLTTRAADERLDMARQDGTAKNDHEIAACIIFEDWYAARA